jgi:pilus assembly protein Flp/PilA
MQSFTQLSGRLMSEDAGQDLIEYALIAVLLGIGAVGALNALGTYVSITLNGVNNAIATAGS